MNVKMPLSVLLMFNIMVTSCDGQNTQCEFQGNCDEGEWPSTTLLISMIDQLRNHFVGSMDKLKAELVHTTKALKAENQQLNLSVQNLVAENQQLNSKVQNFQDRISQLEKKHKKSAFSAYMNTGNLNPGSSTHITVPFKGVKLNTGGDYSSYTSTYTCPVDGIYFFTYSIFSGWIKDSEDDETFAYIEVEGNRINSVHCDIETANDSDGIECQVSNSVTIHCGKGGTVLIKTFGDDVQIDDEHTTFTGFLLYID